MPNELYGTDKIHHTNNNNNN